MFDLTKEQSGKPTEAQDPRENTANQGDQGKGSSPFAAPSISLLKGGGAIRGMGEKFAANPVTGTGSMSVPIATSPGRSGFGPQLSLSYDSGAGNGPFGLGWNLSLPAITRKTDKGLPKYQDADESDVFILSGAEDLVPVFKKDAAGQWVLDAQGKHVIHEEPRNGFLIRFYRPRIEGLFARIERWTDTTTGEVRWRSITKDNITTWYGKSSESRIADPDPNSKNHIFSWLICESYDDKGNAILYRYKHDDSTRVNLAQINEKNRTNSIRETNLYLKRIKYCNRTPQQQGEDLTQRTDWLMEVVFDYGEHDASNPTPNDPGDWLCRDDPFSSYRSGFEARTYRLCRRVLMFHHFEGEEGVGKDCLVRSTDFNYTTNHIASFISSVSQSGYKRQGSGYLKRSLPPVEFKYSEAVIEDKVRELAAESLENLPGGLDGSNYQWIDLDGDGVAGILTEQANAWFYKRNISPKPEKGVTHTVAKFAPVELVTVQPSFKGISGGGMQFLDLAGDGRPDLVQFDGPAPGFYEHEDDDTWTPHRQFTSLPNVNWRDPNLKFVDLTGDGHADILISEDDVFTWYPSLAEAGFGASERTRQFFDEEKGPQLVFADGAQSIFLADFSGDGLTDLVRIRNGEVCYWPNLGYGRFGAKVTMDNSPWFDRSDQFDQRRIRLADIDGSGVTDIIYLHGDGIRLYFNQSGNSWSELKYLNVFPQTNSLSSVAAVDLLGNGTACLVWSSPLPGHARRPMFYVDLMGGQKPHLMISSKNNLGAETRVQYAPSTKFYLEDKYAGKPWITRLPFPVHVIERVETFDHISRNRFVTRYVYHHGYFDGAEREFRGFGMIEQWDTEAFEDYVVGVQHVEGNQALAPELYQPPVTTRTWYHTGAFFDGERILHQFRQEYYRQEQHTPEPALPAGLDAQELRECLRALKGLPLRQEIYSFDGSAQQQDPYSVVENNFEVRLLQPRGGQKHAVFFPIGRESIAFNYERNLDDPRIRHSFRLEVDEYGNARKSCAVVYGRKIAVPALPTKVTRDQQKLYVTYDETDFTPDIIQANPTATYRLRVPYESRSYEITGVSPAASIFRFDEIKPQIAGTADIAYEALADGVTAQKRPLSQGRTLFLDGALNPLPLGQWGSLGLVHQSYQLAFTPGVTGAHYAGKVSDADFTAAGYVHFDGDANWWIPSGTAVYPANPADHFYLPTGARDPLGVETIATLDKYDLLVERVRVTQAAWNETTAVNDYRVLGPVLMTDPNKNRSVVEIDALGMVVKTAVMGKAGSLDGDTLDDPTVRMEYDLFNWINHRQPNFVHTFAREQHGAANQRWQESYAYSNGGGRIAMMKLQAHPGKAFKVNPDGTKVEVDADPRWVGNGRAILNNKGNPVKQYEPYFSTTHEYEDEKVLREIGVTPILYYDPAGRNIRTLFPNGTFTKVEFGPWMQKVFDANDTVKQSQWYADRGSPDPATQPEPLGDPERRAAWLAAKHADTPGTIHFDSLGRPIYAVSDYGGGKTAAARSESDLTGRFTKIFDQHQREVASGFTGMAGHPIVGESAEKGRRWSFQNVLGAIVKTWDEHGREFRAEYDHLHRPLSTFVHEAEQAEILFNYVVYGDRHPNAEQLNLLGVAHQVFDQAGMVRVPELDFKGNPKRVERVLAKDYKNQLDWTALASQPDLAALQAVADPPLEIGEVFTASSQYDALNRPTRVTLPDNTVIVPTYNEANFLASLQAQIRGQGNFIEFLKDQDYDAKGQRRFAHYGNDVFARYFYDPKTFRLTNLLTYKSGAEPDTDSLQNLHYTYDPAGNITQIRDDAQQTHYFNNAVVKPESLYQYDAIYQLIRATGREHAGLGNDTIRTHTDLDFVPQLPHANDASAVRTYTEEYEYDLLGNIKVLKHRFSPQPGIGGGWTRHYHYAYEDDAANRTNRLIATNLPGDPDGGPYSATYDYDAYGNMIRMPHLTVMEWNFMDQLRQVDLGGGGTAYYVYGLGGQRLRKVVERNGNLTLEWIFLGAAMIFRRRRRDTNALRLERWTVHISDNAGRIAQVDTKTRDDDNTDPANPLDAPLIRYQYSNHLGSAVIETDESGNPISYEEYHPFGTTSYRSAQSGFDLSLKRYRFSGKERDDETGLYYFGARYCAVWLGRWISTDPVGFLRETNLFVYCSNNPIVLHDPNGMQTKPLNPAGRVSWEIPSWVYQRNGQRLSDAEATANFERWLSSAHSDRRYEQGSVTIDWSTMRGRRGPTFNARWLRSDGSQLLPDPGQVGSAAQHDQHPPALRQTPGDTSSPRVSEDEHIMPRAQLQDMTTDPDTGASGYTRRKYETDTTLRATRSSALDKTHGNRGGPTADNPTTRALRNRVASGGSVNYREDIFERSRQQAIASGMPEEAVNRAILEQEGNLFSTRPTTLSGQPRSSSSPTTANPSQPPVPTTSSGTGSSGSLPRTGFAGFARGAGAELARNFIPGFVEAEMAAVVAPYAVASAGITNATVVGIADAAAAAPTTFAAAVTLPALGGAIVGNAVESEYGIGAAVASAAITGAVIGTFIPIPGVSTLAGAAIGAAIGVIGYGISKLF
ncbi:MAG: FG-GAP-like repeat-containing protein [Acidobacteria bacterium]|nr:FG-GAP-like repeat-containing protein [Acidobacteriota bacterium]